jgi:AraC-like DNA-binding protein
LAEFIEDGLTRRLTLHELARVAALSPFHFARCFKATTGLSPHQYVQARRIELAKRSIMTSSQPVVEVAWSIRFENIKPLPPAVRCSSRRVAQCAPPHDQYGALGRSLAPA